MMAIIAPRHQFILPPKVTHFYDIATDSDIFAYQCPDCRIPLQCEIDRIWLSKHYDRRLVLFMFSSPGAYHCLPCLAAQKEAGIP